MPDRVLGHVRRSRDECPCHPTVAVVMHDEHESMPERLIVMAVKAARPVRISPPEITEARASLPDTPCTDWFKWYAEAGR